MEDKEKSGNYSCSAESGVVESRAYERWLTNAERDGVAALFMPWSLLTWGKWRTKTN
jgi:hypothetical protein